MLPLSWRCRQSNCRRTGCWGGRRWWQPHRRCPRRWGWLRQRACGWQDQVGWMWPIWRRTHRREPALRSRRTTGDRPVAECPVVCRVNYIGHSTNRLLHALFVASNVTAPATSGVGCCVRGVERNRARRRGQGQEGRNCSDMDVHLSCTSSVLVDGLVTFVWAHIYREWPLVKAWREVSLQSVRGCY